MAMNDVRMFVALEHELQRGPAEKSKPLIVIGLPVKSTPIKKIVLGMRFDKKTFAAVNKPEINAAMDGIVVPRHPKVIERDSQVIDMIVAQAIVLRQDDL